MILNILFGTQTGNAQNLALTIGDTLTQNGIQNEVRDMGAVDPDDILEMNFLLIVTSTFGDGEPPDNASEWMSALKFGEGTALDHLKYAVIGLGDRYYPHFNQCGKDFDQYLSKRGAHAMLKRLDCDLYFEEQYEDWLKDLIVVLNDSVRE
jgi:sulfite reductase (NADPH) flavoprotein alpha-component